MLISLDDEEDLLYTLSLPVVGPILPNLFHGLLIINRNSIFQPLNIYYLTQI